MTVFFSRTFMTFLPKKTEKKINYTFCYLFFLSFFHSCPHCNFFLTLLIAFNQHTHTHLLASHQHHFFIVSIQLFPLASNHPSYHSSESHMHTYTDLFNFILILSCLYIILLLHKVCSSFNVNTFYLILRYI